MRNSVFVYFKALIIALILALFVLACTTFKEITLLRHPVMFLFFHLLSISLHEVSHLIFFKALGLTVTEFSISVFSIKNTDGKITLSLENNRLFSAKCTWVYKGSAALWKYLVALYAGGAAALLLFIAAAFIMVLGSFSAELLILALLSFYNFAFNLIRPNSTDRKLIKTLKDNRGI